MNTRQELLACVRNLPLESGKAIAADVWKSFQVYWRGPILARPRDDADDAIHEPPADNDLCLRYISRHKLLEFTPDDHQLMVDLNAEIAGDQCPLQPDQCSDQQWQPGGGAEPLAESEADQGQHDERQPGKCQGRETVVATHLQAST